MTNGLLRQETSAIIRNERGLSIAGTRITLYDILDYLRQEWTPGWIQYWFNLSDAQILTAMQYIEAHQAEVEAEYDQVLQQVEESRRYWDARNRYLFAQLETLPAQPGQEAIRAKLHERKARLGQL
ncbi:MAG TPA: DUF433 domain-containing protein [Caldilineaceae bacterium]|nr:DUF433 domain-containing protein [Caldilineaceae bacterium]